MARSTDEHGRITLPDDVRERFGDRYRIVELPTHVALFPVDEDPATGLQKAIGTAVDDASVNELREEAREGVRREIRDRDDRRSGGDPESG